MTSRKQLFEIFDEITEKAFQIMEGKNSDYASDEDSLANFRSSEVLNVDPRKALLIRMLDKIKRQVNYIERGELSVDSAEDDVVDLINYSVLLHALNKEQEDKTQEECLDEMTRIAQEMGEYDVDNWGVDELKEGLTWLYKHYYPATKEEATEVPSFCDTPNACHHDGCMCERTDKFVEDEKTEYNVENIWYNRLNESYFITFHNGYGLSLHGKKIVSVETNEVNSLCQLETKDKRYIVEDEQG